MSLLSQAQQESELCSASADHQPNEDPYPASHHAQDLELDAEWLSAQAGAAVGCSHRIVGHLASGGMGHVFVAEHEFLGARAAVKVPRYADVTGRNILEAEARLLAKLEHPNIVRALDVGQLADGRMYLLMEHAQGIELGAWLEASGTVPFERSLAVLRQVASAVDYLHVKGIVHGDIKPANILVDASANDFVKLVDFGIASNATRNARRGVLGTPAYMAPEQARGEAWGPLSDVYAVAALALQMLTGHPPHAHRTAQDVLTAVLTQPAPTPSALGLKVPNLDQVFARALHQDPAQRFQRASAFVTALSEVLVASPAIAASEVGTGNARGETYDEAERGIMQPASDLLRGTPSAAAVSYLFGRLGPFLNDRVVRRVAAGLVAAVFIVSVYG
jgi:serine/threonine-protein kinase